MDMEQDIQDAVGRAIADGQTPGAVVLVGREDEVLYHEAFGQRMVAPEQRPMEPDTIFDLASLTKPIATATAIMQLSEDGDLTLDDPVCRFLPQFVGEGRETATVRDLLRHSSGVPAYKNYLSEFGEAIPPAERRSRVVADICTLPLEHPPGAAIARCAATEQLPEGVLCGVVHDEDARYLGGVGGNAGLFSTAGDLSRFMRATLADREQSHAGALQGARVLSPSTQALMLKPHPAGSDVVRGLGWDMQSSYSPNLRGDHFPPGSFGHSGYTGTSIWADPASRTYLILLTNRVHLGRDRDISRLRREVANAVGASTCI
jgi:CubicO group peptidase (beta-lactamase class C family)